jgi:hypothetical protein
MKHSSSLLIAVGIFAWQSATAQADCSYVNGAVCGAAGNGSISTINGNVSIAQGPGIYPAMAGKQFSVGARILTGSNATAQANLGAGCFAPLGPSSVAMVTSQKGLTCLSQSGARWADYTASDLPTAKPGVYGAPPPSAPEQPYYDPALIAGLAIVGVGVGAVICALECFPSHQSVSP